jgi:hypothetical protein
MKKIRTLLMMIMILIISSCGGFGKEMKQLMILQTKIQKKYKVSIVKINLVNNNVLNVTFVNSQYGNYSDKQKGSLAQDLGLFCKKEFVTDSSLKEGILFLQQEQNYGIVKSSQQAGYPMKF